MSPTTLDVEEAVAPELPPEAVSPATMPEIEEGAAPESSPEQDFAPTSPLENKEASPVSETAPVSVEADQSVPAQANEVKPAVVPKAETAPHPPKDSRSEPRLHVKWHADAMIEGHGIYRGFVKEISLHGTDIFLDVNLHKVKLLKLRIYVPPATKTSSAHIIEASAKVTYTAYDSKEALFHIGMSFTQFNLESDRDYLQARITAFNRAK